MKYSITILLFLVLTFGHIFAAKVKYTREYYYNASEADSKLSCRTIALEQVKKLLLEEVGVYLESHTEIINYQLSKDEITSITAGIIKTNIIDEKWDGKVYWLKAEIVIDPDEVNKQLKEIQQNRHNLFELKKAREKTEKLLEKIYSIKNELNQSRTKISLFEQYKKTINEINASDHLQRGIILSIAGLYLKAIDEFEKAINKDNNFGDAYIWLGSSYAFLGNYNKALALCEKGIKLTSNKLIGYICKAFSLGMLGNYDQALNYINLALNVAPEDIVEVKGMIYYVRGTLHYRYGYYDYAIDDINLAIKLFPQFSGSYICRAKIYLYYGNYSKYLDELKKAARLGNMEAQNFLRSSGIIW